MLEACQLLKEYAQFVNQVREYAKEVPITEAVENAVDYCIEHDILADFLSKNRMEAVDMCIFEFNEEKFLKSEREWSYNSGREEARKEAKINFAALTVKTIESAMKNFNIDLPAACKALDTPIEEYEKAKALIAMVETK